jgi:ornithine decarboxylase
MARFVLSKSRLSELYESVKHLGLVSYSFKTNPIVGGILEDSTDCMFSVHFVNELRLIKDKSRVWFLAQVLDEKKLDELFSFGVFRFVVENPEDLEVLLAYITARKKKIELLLRMKLKENTIKTERYYVFGMDSDAVNKMIVSLSGSQFITALGVHVHRKTQNVSEWDLVREISELIDDENWKRLDYLNIGGGIPAMYKNISDKIIPTVMQKISEFRDWLASKDVQLIIEPGRYLSASCIRLETTVVGVHGRTIVVDASVYNSSPDTLIVPIKLLVEGELEIGEPGKAYVIKGITPCSTDLFRYRVYFSEPPQVGGMIVFLNAGAYNFHTEFCELDKIETVVEP